MPQTPYNYCMIKAVNLEFTAVSVLHLLALSGLLVVDIMYWWWTLLLYVLLMPLMLVIMHDWICHGYVQPRGRLSLAIVTLLNIIWGLPVKDKKQYHDMHHQTWRTPARDITGNKLINTTLLAYLLRWRIHNNIELDGDRPKDHLQYPMIWRLERYHWLLKLAIFVSAWLALPLEIFFMLFVWYPWLAFVFGSMNEYWFHGPVQNNDNGWFMPVWSSAAWHRSHHEKPGSAYYGPGFWRWLNPGYYYQLALFKPS